MPNLRVSLGFIGVVVFGSAAYAQPATPRQWEIAVTIGTSSAGPAADVEAAMRASGFNEPSGGCIFGLCFPVEPTPTSHTGLGASGNAYAVQVTYRPRRGRVGAALLYGHTPIGETFGIHVPYSPLYIDYRVDTIAALATFGTQAFTASAGPAWHLAAARQLEPMSGAGDWEGHHKFGAIVQARMAVPARTRLFFDFNGQYRYVGQASVGPFTAVTVFEPAAKFSQSSVSFNHWLIALGGGLRF